MATRESLEGNSVQNATASLWQNMGEVSFGEKAPERGDDRKELDQRSMEIIRGLLEKDTLDLKADFAELQEYVSARAAALGAEQPMKLFLKQWHHIYQLNN